MVKSLLRAAPCRASFCFLEQSAVCCTNQPVFFFMVKGLGPVVQSVVILTSSLRVISLTVLADSIYNILIFFAEKM